MNTKFRHLGEVGAIALREYLNDNPGTVLSAINIVEAPNCAAVLNHKAESITHVKVLPNANDTDRLSLTLRVMLHAKDWRRYDPTPLRPLFDPLSVDAGERALRSAVRALLAGDTKLASLSNHERAYVKIVGGVISLSARAAALNSIELDRAAKVARLAVQQSRKPRDREMDEEHLAP